jgi:hypothetical protein
MGKTTSNSDQKKSCSDKLFIFVLGWIAQKYPFGAGNCISSTMDLADKIIDWDIVPVAGV